MNLADAIRQAAGQVDCFPKAPPAESAARPFLTAEPTVSTLNPTMSNPNIQLNANGDSGENAAASFGNFLRLELFLAPEQLSALLSAVVKTQHSVLTLREAASFLRLPIATVAQLASEKKLPAFAIEGKWRFSHSALEEWLTSHPRSASDGKELQ